MLDRAAKITESIHRWAGGEDTAKPNNEQAQLGTGLRPLLYGLGRSMLLLEAYGLEIKSEELMAARILASNKIKYVVDGSRNPSTEQIPQLAQENKFHMGVFADLAKTPIARIQRQSDDVSGLIGVGLESAGEKRPLVGKLIAYILRGVVSYGRVVDVTDVVPSHIASRVEKKAPVENQNKGVAKGTAEDDWKAASEEFRKTVLNACQ